MEKNINLEPIHISFSGGSRGEFLSAIVYTALHNKLPIYEISNNGKMRIRFENDINKEHKIVNEDESITLDKIPKEQFEEKIVKRNCSIGISHYAAELYRYEQVDFVSNCYFVKLLKSSPVIIIDYEEDDIASLAIQSHLKNNHKSYAELVDCKNRDWLHMCKKHFPNFGYVKYKDLTTDVPKVLKIINDHTGINLFYNQYTEILLNEYKEKNKQYGVSDRTRTCIRGICNPLRNRSATLT